MAGGSAATAHAKTVGGACVHNNVAVVNLRLSATLLQSLEVNSQLSALSTEHKPSRFSIVAAQAFKTSKSPP